MLVYAKFSRKHHPDIVRKLGLELKIIISITLFTLFIVEYQRFELSTEVVEQFVAAKHSKNSLLIDTIVPIVTLQVSLELDQAYREYLDNIVDTNRDVRQIEITDPLGRIDYRQCKTPAPPDAAARDRLNFAERRMADELTMRELGTIRIDFFDDDYRAMQRGYDHLMLKVLLITLVAMTLLLALIKWEFKHLKRLSEGVNAYDPAQCNFTISPTKRRDEVGIIQNAVVQMVQKINAYADLLDDANRLLERKVRERTEALEAANTQLKRLSTTDPLTRLPNRRNFEQFMPSTWELAKRSGVPLCIILCDLDHFKRINDTYGHFGGDQVLQAVAQVLQSVLKRSTDFVARYGGEEFIVVLYDADVAQANTVCERIRQEMRGLVVKTEEGAMIDGITFSFGVNVVVPSPSAEVSSALRQADAALYRAKENGRDRIEVHAPDGSVTR